MKLPIVFLAVLGLVYGKSLPARSLQDDLDDFLALVPTDKILEIALDYLANDPEVQEAVIYLQSEEFHFILTTVEALPEFKDFVKFISDLGVDIYTIINTIHDILGLPPFQPKHSTRRGVGLNGLIEDIIAVLPVDELKALFDEKIATSPDFQALVAGIQSDEFAKIVETLRALPQYQELLERLREKGVDVDKFIELLRALFGLSRKGTRTLQDDLDDFLALVPTDKILEIALDYLANDPEVQEAVIYLQSEEFHFILLTVEALPEFKDFVKFISDLGVDVYTIINTIHDILGLPPFQPKHSTHRGVGLNGLIDDIIAVLPIDELKALFDEKLATSPDFQALVAGIQSDEFAKIVETLRALPEYQELLERLREKGVDVDKFIELLRALFGLSRKGTRTLQDDLDDFLALVPTDKILEIALDYLANDPEVQEAVIYLQSEEFHFILLTVEALPEFKDFVKFISDLGVDVYTIINTIHDILGLPPFQPKHSTRRGVGLNGLIEDIIAVLPVDELKALFDEKLATSPDFQALVAGIQSDEFAKIVETLRALPQYQELLERLREKGVDVDKFIELLRALFGLSRKGTRTLQDDLDDFLALVPTDKILEIALDYLANDPEVQEAVIYLQSEEFHFILLTVEALPEFKDFVKFISDLGVDVYTIINTIHDILGLPPFQPKHSTRRGVGLNGLIDDIIAVLPIDELKALFDEKLATSPDFQALVAGIQSDEFAKIVETLRALPEYQELLERLREKGVDVDKFIELLRALFGLSRKGTRTLQDDLDDFLALVPTDKILEIALDYLANDPEVQEAVIYLQSEEFHFILLTVEALPEFKDFVKFISDLGVDVYTIINTIHDILGLPPFQPKHSTRRGVGLNGLIDDIIAVLPIDELKALFDEKLATSPDFQALVAGIQSDEFAKIVETLRALPEYQELLERLREKGVDVDKFIELLRALFGLSRKGTRTLQDDLDDFLALVPTDKILEIALDYLANDPEVQEAVIYLQSEEFHFILLTVEALPEFKDFVKFISDLGVDVYTIINTIHDILGLPPFQPKHSTRRGVGLNGLIEDIIAVLPVDELKALFDEKLATSPDFQALVAGIQSDEFAKIVETLRALPQYQELLERLREKGVDVDKFIELLRALFGLSR